VLVFWVKTTARKQSPMMWKFQLIIGLALIIRAHGGEYKTELILKHLKNGVVKTLVGASVNSNLSQ